MNNPRIILVTGYHKDTPVPDECKNLELTFRFGIILTTFLPEYNYNALHFKLIKEMINNFINENMCDCFWLTINDNIRINSLQTFEQILSDEQIKNSSLVIKTEFVKNTKIFCLQFSEFWCYCGGPDPYHDSYTFSFYTARDMSKQFILLSDSICKKLNFDIIEKINGNLLPSSPSKIKFFINLLSNKFLYVFKIFLYVFWGIVVILYFLIITKVLK